MPPVPPRVRSRVPWTLVPAAALLLVGCGSGESAETQPASKGGPKPPGKAQVAATTGVPDAEGAAAPQPAEATAFDIGAGVNSAGDVTIMPFQIPREGPIEYEEGTEKPLVTTFPSALEDETPPAIEDLPSDDELLGRPLVIDGVVVPFVEIKRQVCLGSIGVPEIALARLWIFIEEERQRLIEAGAPADRLDLQPDEVEAYLSTVDAGLKEEYPEGELKVQDLLDGLASSEPKRKLHSQMLFARLFLPHDPANFPPLTLEAILKHQGGQVTLDHYKTLHEQSLAAGYRIEDAGQAQFDEVILQQVLRHLIDVAAIETDPAPGVLYRVNGVNITVDQIWDKIKTRVTTMDVLAAKQWIVKTTLLKKALMGSGSWLNDEEAYAAYHAHSDPYKDSIFSIESVALMVKQFPSIERYTEHRRIQDSFERMRKPSDEDIRRFAEYRSDKIIGQVSVDADVILCSAWDFKLNRWKENGWAEAENRMKDVVRLLVEEQRPWEELVEKYSDYYEPPTPKSKRGQETKRSSKGRFRDMQRNAMLRELGENDYYMFLSGNSVTDFIFFEQEVKSLGQPMRGPLGWYLPRLIRRTKPPPKIQMDEPTHRELVLDDYLTTELNKYAQQLVERAEVYGLEYPGT